MCLNIKKNKTNHKKILLHHNPTKFTEQLSFKVIGLRIPKNESPHDGSTRGSSTALNIHDRNHVSPAPCKHVPHHGQVIGTFSRKAGYAQNAWGGDPGVFSHDDVFEWKHFPRDWSLWRESTGHRWIPLTKARDAGLWRFLWSAPNKRLSKQLRRRWFETPSCSLWRHCNARNPAGFFLQRPRLRARVFVCTRTTHATVEYIRVLQTLVTMEIEERIIQ